MTPDVSQTCAWLREWADKDLGPAYMGNKNASLGYIAARQIEELRTECDAVRAELTNLQIAFNDWKVFHSTVELEARHIIERDKLKVEPDELRALLTDIMNHQGGHSLGLRIRNRIGVALGFLDPDGSLVVKEKE